MIDKITTVSTGTSEKDVGRFSAEDIVRLDRGVLTSKKVGL
jgi:hypothetical protein